METKPWHSNDGIRELCDRIDELDREILKLATEVPIGTPELTKVSQQLSKARPTLQHAKMLYGEAARSYRKNPW